MMRHWSLTNGEAGWITSAFYGAYMLAVPVLVTLTDRIDAKRVYLFGVGCTVVAHLAFGLLAEQVYTLRDERRLCPDWKAGEGFVFDTLGLDVESTVGLIQQHGTRAR